MERERLPFTFQSHTGSPTGYAETAAVMMRAFWEEGLEVHYSFIADDPMYEPSSGDAFVDGLRSIEPEKGLPTIVYSTAPVFWNNGGGYKIGWTMMEVDRINDKWVRACNSQDEIWVPTPLQKLTFRESGVEVPIYVVPLCIDERKYRPTLTAAIYHPEAKFRFFGMGWWQQRKRWDLLLEAFEEEFGGDKDVALIIKTMSAESDDAVVDQAIAHLSKEAMDQVAVICGPLPWWEVAMIMRGCHAFVLPTAGEGYGCPPLQALASGLPVVITDCMGPGEVLRDSKGQPFPGVRFVPSEVELTKVQHPYYTGANWWTIDYDGLRKGMREVYENYEDWKEAALKGSVKVRRERSGAVTARVVRKQLERIYRDADLANTWM